MSSILKALQKLEQEKSTKPEVGIGVAKGIVGNRRPARRHVWVVPAGMLGVAMLAVLLTYTLMGGFISHKPAPAIAATVSTEVVQAQPAAEPSPLLTYPIKEKNIASKHLPTVTKRSTLKPPASPAPATQPSLIVPSIAETSPHLATSSPDNKSKTADYTEKISPQHTTKTTRLPSIKVSGIAWQKDSTARLAVVNGIAVTEGSSVEGALIVEITHDRVRFSYKNEKFDLTLGKGTP